VLASVCRIATAGDITLCTYRCGLHIEMSVERETVEMPTLDTLMQSGQFGDLKSESAG